MQFRTDWFGAALAAGVLVASTLDAQVFFAFNPAFLWENETLINLFGQSLDLFLQLLHVFFRRGVIIAGSGTSWGVTAAVWAF